VLGGVKAPPPPFPALGRGGKAILLAFVVAIFAFGLFPREPLLKTELAARDYQQRVLATRLPETAP